MFQLKPISRESVPGALEKAERYRLLNEPWQTESICSDILDADPGNVKAVITLLLAITDQFDTSSMGDVKNAKRLLSSIPDGYEREYYSGIICERKGKSFLSISRQESDFIAYEWLRDAMDHYERAEAIRPPGNDDTILRWNTCVRLITHHNLAPRREEYIEPPLE
ncbi:MAG TPA: hypothetical protein VF939_18180 [Puia sp.]